MKLPRTAWILSIAFWCMSLQTGSAQSGFSFSGYVVDIPVAERTNEFIASLLQSGRDQFINVTRVRLRPSTNLWENAHLELEYEITSAYHSASGLIPLQQNRPRRQVARLSWQPVDDPHFSLLHFIDRLTFTQRIAGTETVVGRQRISWGTGRIWNPTDLFNPLSPTSFAKIEKDGIDAVSTKLFLGDFTDLQLVFNPQRDGHANAGYRFRTNFSEFDLSTIGGVFDTRAVAGGDFAGNLLDAGVRGEFIVSANHENLRSNFTTFILGADYQFTSKLYGLVEYYHNGEGKTDKSSYELQRLIDGEILNLARDYVAIEASYLVHPLVTASVLTIANVTDGSRFYSGTVTYSASDNATLTLGGQLFPGGDYSEYWYYPASVFLKGEYFF